jgi:hypothetical protein
MHLIIRLNLPLRLELATYTAQDLLDTTPDPPLVVCQTHGSSSDSEVQVSTLTHLINDRRQRQGRNKPSVGSVSLVNADLNCFTLVLRISKDMMRITRTDRFPVRTSLSESDRPETKKSDQSVEAGEPSKPLGVSISSLPWRARDQPKKDADL